MTTPLSVERAIAQEYRKAENHLLQLHNIALGILRFVASAAVHAAAFAVLVLLYLIAITPQEIPVFNPAMRHHAQDLVEVSLLAAALLGVWGNTGGFKWVYAERARERVLQAQQHAERVELVRAAADVVLNRYRFYAAQSVAVDEQQAHE